MHSMIVHCLVDGTTDFPTMPQSRVVRCDPDQLVAYVYKKQPDLVVIESEVSDVPRLTEIVRELRHTYGGSILVVGEWTDEVDLEPLLLCGAQDVLQRSACRAVWQTRMINLLRLDSRETRGHFRRAESLRKAIDNGKVVVHLQPIMDLVKAKPKAFECLARLKDDAGNLVPPAQFIPVAEKSGLIVPLGREIFRLGLEAAQAWRHETDVSFTFNLSTVQLTDSTFFEDIVELTENSGISPDRIVFEITESEPLAEDSSIGDTLEDLRAKGFRLAIDDFGTGYSALEYLTRIRFDILKLDRKFLNRIERGDLACDWIRSVIMTALRMGIDVVAEGIESREHVDFLKTCGKVYGQGFYLGRPAPAQSFSRNHLRVVA